MYLSTINISTKLALAFVTSNNTIPFLGYADLTPHIPGVISTNVQDGPFKIFIGNLPTYLTEDQVWYGMVWYCVGLYGTFISIEVLLNLKLTIARCK